MGMCRFSDRNVAKLNAKYGTEFVRAAVRSGGLVEGITADDTHITLDRYTRETEVVVTPESKSGHWTSCRSTDA